MGRGEDVLIYRLTIRSPVQGPPALDIRPLLDVRPPDPRLQRHAEFQLLQVDVQPGCLPDLLLVGLQHAGDFEHAQSAELAERFEFFGREDVDGGSLDGGGGRACGLGRGGGFLLVDGVEDVEAEMASARVEK